MLESGFWYVVGDTIRFFISRGYKGHWKIGDGMQFIANDFRNTSFNWGFCDEQIERWIQEANVLVLKYHAQKIEKTVHEENKCDECGHYMPIQSTLELGSNVNLSIGYGQCFINQKPEACQYYISVDDYKAKALEWLHGLSG